MRKSTLLLAGLALVGCAGCGRNVFGGGPGDEYVKPTIAVMKFENRAPFPLNWNLGGGMKDILVDRLIATDRFQVIERPELDSVLRELQFQHSGATREQLRAARGRIKNVQYLIKGTITDFGHVSTSSGFLNLANWDIFQGKTRAVMGMTFYVVDVESGEIICSEHLEKSVRAKDVRVQAVYKGVAFGGSVFHRTPLGKATAGVIGKAVKRIASSVASRPWEAKVAVVQPDGTVIINGGRNHGVAFGHEYEVLEAGRAIFDPDTGDMIGQQPGKCLGRLRICEVHKRYSVAKVTSGEPQRFQVGQRCRKVEPEMARAPAPE